LILFVGDAQLYQREISSAQRRVVAGTVANVSSWQIVLQKYFEHFGEKY
jgi:hypothetical protein